jgi:hypothetical protein
LDKADRLHHEMMLCYFAGTSGNTRGVTPTAASTVATPIALNSYRPRYG